MEPRFEEQHIREPVFAGKFYPASEHALHDQLDELFDAAKQEPVAQKPPLAVISPHAGYVFSGKTAAAAFSQIPDNTTCKRVFVIASSHQFLFGGASVYNEGNYSTPLGELTTDIELATKLGNSSDVIHFNAEAHQFEHSLEVQLPFLQHKLGNNFLLVPLILGTNNPEDCKEIAKVLEPYFQPENLFVISTDFSHYPEYEEAVENDTRTARAICSNNPKKLQQTLKENEKKKIRHLATSLCGWTSVLTLLYLTEHKNVTYQKINYTNSGDSGLYAEKDRVVGYWAISVTEKEPDFYISEEEKKELFKKARNSIVNYLETGKRGTPAPPETGGILNEQAGVFVSVYVNGELRGCIGNFAKDETLNDLVQRMAVSAACDRRFENLHYDELENMELEISVLSPLKKIDSIDEIELGKDGIFIKKGFNSGTFLPQVAQKTGWNPEEFLGHCSRDKAGLGWDGWKDAELYTYEAVIFRG